MSKYDAEIAEVNFEEEDTSLPPPLSYQFHSTTEQGHLKPIKVSVTARSIHTITEFKIASHIKGCLR